MQSSTAFWLMLLLGVYHGINPGMGWLFAVALGMQQEKASAVERSLVPIAIGHALAVGVVVLAAAFLGKALPLDAIRYPVAASLIGLGIHRLVRHRHPRWVRMQVGFRDLTVWSFLMASAHGAGLMVLPLVLGAAVPAAHVHRMALASLGLGSLEWSGLAAAAVPSAGYLLATGAIAAVVYERVGLRFLRTAWVNLDLLWAVALVVTGVATVAL